MKKNLTFIIFILFITTLLLVSINSIATSIYKAEKTKKRNNSIYYNFYHYDNLKNKKVYLNNKNKISDGIYIISSPYHNNYLVNNNISLINTKGTENDKWYIEKLSNGYYKISSYINYNIVLELDINNNSFKLNKFNNKSNQQWKIIVNNDNTYSLINNYNNSEFFLINNKKNNYNSTIIKTFKLINITNTKENTDRIPVFTFHRIVSDELKHSTYEDDQWVESVKAFEKQIKYLSDNGYKTISMDEFYCWYNQNCIFDNKTIMITFDDGNLEDYYLVLPILKKYNIKATTFIVGKRTLDGPIIFDENNRQYLTKDIIKKVKKEYPNWEFQSHTYDMHSITNGRKKIQDMTEEEIKNDFDNQEIFKFSYLAYPYGEYNDYIQEELKKHNYKLAFTFRNYEYATRTFTPYEIPRIKINGYSTVEDLKQWLNY